MISSPIRRIIVRLSRRAQVALAMVVAPASMSFAIPQDPDLAQRAPEAFRAAIEQLRGLA